MLPPLGRAGIQFSVSKAYPYAADSAWASLSFDNSTQGHSSHSRRAHVAPPSYECYDFMFYVLHKHSTER